MGKPMKDPQKARVYAWEDTFRSFGERTLTRAVCIRVIKRCVRKYGVPMPKVLFRSRIESMPLRIASDYDPSVHLITLGYNDCNHAVCCHEAAHAIIDWQELDVEDHGPLFMGVYMDLLVYTAVAPRAALEASAEQAGIRWVAL